MGELVKRSGPIARRTPLPRGTPLRKKGKKVRNHVDLPNRRAYKNLHEFCEVTPMFVPFVGNHDDASRYPVKQQSYFMPIPAKTRDVHHIMSGFLGIPRSDKTTNIICLCRRVHNWVEEFAVDGLMLCLNCKAKKQELDCDAMGSMLREGGDAEAFTSWLESLESRIVFDVGRRAFRELMGYLGKEAA